MKNLNAYTPPYKASPAMKMEMPLKQTLLTAANAIGRRVRVPSACWPTYPCTEHGGLGWTALITTLQRPNAAIVRFVDAADDRGLPFADVKLDLMVLIPF